MERDTRVVVVGLTVVLLFAVSLSGFGYLLLEDKQKTVAAKEREVVMGRKLAQAEAELALRMQPEQDVLDRFRAEWAAQKSLYETQLAAQAQELAARAAKITALDAVPALDPLRKLLATLQGEIGSSAKISMLMLRVQELENRKVCHCGK